MTEKTVGLNRFSGLRAGAGFWQGGWMPIFNFKEQPKKTDLPEWMLTIPPGQLLTTFPYDSEYGRLVNEGMMKAERLFACDLMAELERQNVPGAIVEFGVFDGTWLACLADHREKLNANREVWGFDSFEGLPATTEHDLDCWKEGDYAADFETVSRRLKTSERPWLKLRKGWFAETLPRANDLGKIAFARIDCDLYEPAAECLEFLAPRLSKGAVLVFDDWTYNREKGETKAFLEFLAAYPQISAEHLHSNSIGHFYFRILL